MMIDYSYIHNKKCELLDYLKERNIETNEQMEEDIHRILQEIAYNEKYMVKEIQ